MCTETNICISRLNITINERKAKREKDRDYGNQRETNREGEKDK